MICNYLEKTKRSRRTNEVDKNLMSREQEIKRKCVMKSVKMKKLNQVQKLLNNENDMEPWGRDAHAKVIATVSPLVLIQIEVLFQ